MNDAAAIGIFLACLIVTFGLLRLCEWLRPREAARAAPASAPAAKETRP